MDEETKILYQLIKDFQNYLSNIMKEQLVNTSPFVYKYNKLRKMVGKKFPEVKKYTTNITGYEGVVRPSLEIRDFSAVKMETNSLVVFLEEKLGKSEEIVKNLLGVLGSKLRPTFRELPKSEGEVQEKVDTVLNVSNFSYLREQVTIPFSSKYFKPDFTFENENTVLEVKFCGRTNREKELIDEINGDIKAYKTKYKKLIFLVYDLGFIRDVDKFKQDIHNDTDIYIEVIKH